MNIKGKIKNNEKLYYFARMIQNRNNPEFRSWVIDISDSPSMIRVQKFGDNNSDKLLYLIDIDDDGNHSGFFSLLNGTVKRLELADRMGATPYIRWVNTPYGKSENAFSDYFIEPSDIEYDELLKSKNVIISRPQDGFARDESRVYAETSGFLEEMGGLYGKYIHLRSDIESLIESDARKLEIVDFSHTIGIHVRGTDYRQSLKGHPKAVMYEEYANEIDRLPEEYEDWPIFLATDDNGAIEYFIDKYGRRIRYFQDVFRGDSNLGIHYMHDERDNHKFRLGYEVLRDTYTLSECGALIAGVSFVSFTSRALKITRKEKYEYKVIINRGINNSGTTSKEFNNEFNGKNGKRNKG